MPAIRTLCKAFKKPAAAPHIFVGVSSILKLLREQTSAAALPSLKRVRRSTGSIPTSKVIPFDDNQIPVLIIVVAIYALSVLSPQDFEGGEEYKKKKELAVNTILRVAPEDSTTVEETSNDVELFLREAQNGWLEMEWYQNLTQQSRADELDEEMNGHNSEDEDERGEDNEDPVSRQSRTKRKGVNGINDDENLSKRTGGGMMTPATDWLSEERKKEYRLWKSKFLIELDRAEKGKVKA
jgi:origin recognition complex subunit 6